MTVNTATLAVQIHNQSVHWFTKPVVSLVSRMFGCWHLHMAWPIRVGGETYRACLDCGAHRRFDSDSWTTQGPFYF